MDHKLEFNKIERVPYGYIQIPREIIERSSLGKLRVSVFSLLSMKRGVDNEIIASVPMIVKWLRRKEDRHKDGINENVESLIQQFRNLKYISDAEDNYGLKLPVYSYNAKTVYDQNKFGFATLYSDEIKKILDYSGDSVGKSRYNLDTCLLVFAYLRMMIPRRKNEIFMSEITDSNGFQYRKEIYPEAYYSYYHDIASAIGLTCEAVSMAVGILAELGLIIMHESYYGKKMTDYMARYKIFANTYKRENDYLLATGKAYYESEIKNCANKYLKSK